MNESSTPSTLGLLFLSCAAAGCTGAPAPDVPPPHDVAPVLDGGARDGGVDGGARDGGALDSGLDGGSHDGGLDAPEELDAPADAGTDARDAPPDAPRDASTDAPIDPCTLGCEVDGTECDGDGVVRCVPDYPRVSVDGRVCWRRERTACVGGEVCFARHHEHACVAAGACGDGSWGPGEGCDDGNVASGDGCSATCAVEPGFACEMSPSLCAWAEIEPNDDGMAESGPWGNLPGDFLFMATAAADANFTALPITASGGHHRVIGEISPVGDEDYFAVYNDTATPVSFAVSTSRLAPGYGIGARCGYPNLGFYMPHIHLQVPPFGSVDASGRYGQIGDSCEHMSYELMPGEWGYVSVMEYGEEAALLPYAIDFHFAPDECGTGIASGTEGCDDGNTLSGDGCSSTCTAEGGYECRYVSPSDCHLVCSNAIIDVDETCDDGNVASGDGCSAACEVESDEIAAPSGLPAPIPDDNASSPFVTTAEVTSTCTLAAVDLTFTLSHDALSNVFMTLISPTGTRVELIDGYVYDLPFSGTYTFSVGLGGWPFVKWHWVGPSRRYDRSEMGLFAGEAANGTWSLEIVDSAPGHTGTLGAWSLAVRCE